MVEVGVAVRVRGGDVADGVAGGVVEEGAIWPRSKIKIDEVG